MGTMPLQPIMSDAEIDLLVEDGRSEIPWEPRPTAYVITNEKAHIHSVRLGNG